MAMRLGMSSPLKSHSEHLLKPRASFAFPLDLSHFYFNQSQIRLILTNITIYFRLILSWKYPMTFFEKCTCNFDLKRRISNDNLSLHKVFKPIIENLNFLLKQRSLFTRWLNIYTGYFKYGYSTLKLYWGYKSTKKVCLLTK